VIRHRVGVLLSWAAAYVILAPAAKGLADRLVASTYLRESESAAVEDELTGAFGSVTSQRLLLVARGLPHANSSDRDESIARIAEALRDVPGVTSIQSWLSTNDELLLGTEPGSAILVLGVNAGTDSPDSLVIRLREASTALLDQLGPEATLKLSGTHALSLDLRHASSLDARRAETRALPASALFLLIAFGSLGAALLPAVFGALAIVASLGAATVVSGWWVPTVMLQSVVSVLGLALGIDFALLSVSRFREGLAEGLSPRLAAGQAAERAGRVIALSGSTVALGFLALLSVPVEEIRSVALGGLLTVTFAVLLATTLLPALLSWVGRGIDFGRLRGRGRAKGPHWIWRKWGDFVTDHPWRVLVAAGVPVVLLCLPGLRVSTMTPEQEWLPAEMESAQALKDLGDIGRSGLANTITVIVEMPEGMSVLEGDGWTLADSLGRQLMRDQHVLRVRSLPVLAASFPVPRAMFLGLLPDSVRRELVTPDADRARIDLIPTEDASMTVLAELVRGIRSGSMNGLAADGVTLRVGGIPGYQVDYEDVVGRALPAVIAWVVLGTFVMLALGFQSVLIPFKATVLNLLSVGASFGALVLVFQDGHGLGWFGLETPLEGVFPAIPILSFAIVFGLSMDYEVFLVGRVAEVRRDPTCESEKEAIVEGLSRTGRVITGAATIMVIVFAAFTLGDYLPVRLLGFCLAVAVLVDASLVRLAIGPALLTLAGRWNWWPGVRPLQRGSGP
jgi:RND superfamily putative drug exporter